MVRCAYPRRVSEAQPHAEAQRLQVLALVEEDLEVGAQADGDLLPRLDVDAPAGEPSPRGVRHAVDAVVPQPTEHVQEGLDGSFGGEVDLGAGDRGERVQGGELLGVALPTEVQLQGE